jgi:hypothetical protein
MKANSVYYVNTRKALRDGTYISPQQMKSDLSVLPFYDEEHAHKEILRAVKDHHESIEA